MRMIDDVAPCHPPTPTSSFLIIVIRSSSASTPAKISGSLSMSFSAIFTDILSHGSSSSNQGLTLVHFSAQPEPFLTRNTPLKPPTPPNTPRHLLNSRKTTPKQTLNAPPVPQKALTLS